MEEPWDWPQPTGRCWAGTISACTAWTPISPSFSILPPYNTIHAQLIDASGTPGDQRRRRDHSHLRGRRRSRRLDQHDLRPARPISGSYVPAAVRRCRCRPTWACRSGAESYSMPGAGNVPQADDASIRPRSWFAAYGIPITPYDDALTQEPLPDDAPGGATTGAARSSPAPTSCCRSPTRWTAGPATLPAPAPPRSPPPAGSTTRTRSAITG